MLSAFAADPYSFRLDVPFRIDDLEEPATNLVVSGNTSNTNLISNISVTQYGTNSSWKLLSFSTRTNTSGNATILINVCDSGLTANYTPLLSVTPNLITTTNSDSISWPLFSLIGSNNAVHLKWYPSQTTTRFGYKINRYSTNNTFFDKYFTIGQTFATNFVDTNVVNGTTYWYAVIWTPMDILPSPTNVLCTNIPIELRIREPIVLMPYPPSSVCFVSRSNAIYQVFSKTNSSQVLWDMWMEINTPKDKLIMISDVGDKILYVREKE